jgi:hypothetical protein
LQRGEKWIVKGRYILVATDQVHGPGRRASFFRQVCTPLGVMGSYNEWALEQVRCPFVPTPNYLAEEAFAKHNDHAVE